MLTLTCVPNKFPEDWHDTVAMTLLIDILLLFVP
jgi:hypothetical protein